MSAKRDKVGVVYSTNPDYQYQYDDEPIVETLPIDKQKLRVSLEKHHRGGKTVTLVTGFVGTSDDLDDLCRMLKNKCGVGGSAKDGEILIQGENVEKVKQILKAAGYNVR